MKPGIEKLLKLDAPLAAAYAAWRLAMAVLDPEQQGTDAHGLVKRAGYLISAVSYGTLAYAAYRILQGGSASGGSGGAEEGAQQALALPGGRFVLAAVALAVLGYGGYEFIRAHKASFMFCFFDVHFLVRS